MERFLNKIIQGDCIEVMQQIPSDSIDVTFADPPFNLKKNYSSYKDEKDTDDYLSWCKKWILEMVRITKPSGSIFLHNIPKWLTYYTEFLNEVADFRHWIAWDAPTAPMGKTLQPSHYGILFYAKNQRENKFYEIRYPHKRCRKCGYLLKDYGGKKKILHPFGPLVSDIWSDIHRIRHNKHRDPHPCQLPIHLLERILLMSTDEGDVVLDPFMGTGTTAVAAARLGRNVIGIDIDAEYVEITRNKLAQETANSKIEDIWVSFYLGEIVTIANKDWEALKSSFVIPDDMRRIDSDKIKTNRGFVAAPPQSIQMTLDLREESCDCY
ncbi:site-specific DNA-methyltransferase [Candidatus Poribacteria bacterium]|nr:site-specific DNA-methyltransferase [Candidatus Poribacteria bacterium]MYB63497.1 site-specific DNA-methyltransferase [Candidatus Poribacteria bacterium]